MLEMFYKFVLGRCLDTFLALRLTVRKIYLVEIILRWK